MKITKTADKKLLNDFLAHTLLISHKHYASSVSFFSLSGCSISGGSPVSAVFCHIQTLCLSHSCHCFTSCVCTHVHTQQVINVFQIKQFPYENYFCKKSLNTSKKQNNQNECYSLFFTIDFAICVYSISLFVFTFPSSFDHGGIFVLIWGTSSQITQCS